MATRGYTDLDRFVSTAARRAAAQAGNHGVLKEAGLFTSNTSQAYSGSDHRDASYVVTFTSKANPYFAHSHLADLFSKALKDDPVRVVSVKHDDSAYQGWDMHKKPKVLENPVPATFHVHVAYQHRDMERR